MLRYSYGLTPEQYDAMVIAQGGVCAACGEDPTPRGLVVDHDHACCPGDRSCGRCVRQLLCHHCNTLEGQLRDTRRVAMVQAYMERWDATRAA